MRVICRRCQIIFVLTCVVNAGLVCRLFHARQRLRHTLLLPRRQLTLTFAAAVWLLNTATILFIRLFANMPPELPRVGGACSPPAVTYRLSPPRRLVTRPPYLVSCLPLCPCLPSHDQSNIVTAHSFVHLVAQQADVPPPRLPPVCRGLWSRPLSINTPVYVTSPTTTFTPERRRL